MFKLYFELTEFDDVGQVMHSDSYLINLDRSGIFYKVIIVPLAKLFKKWSIL